MTERMKHHVWQPCVLLQSVEAFFDIFAVTGTPVVVRDNKVIVEILIPEKFFLLLLGIPPFTQNVGEGFR